MKRFFTILLIALTTISNISSGDAIPFNSRTSPFKNVIKVPLPAASAAGMRSV